MSHCVAEEIETDDRKARGGGSKLNPNRYMVLLVPIAIQNWMAGGDSRGSDEAGLQPARGNARGSDSGAGCAVLNDSREPRGRARSDSGIRDQAPERREPARRVGRSGRAFAAKMIPAGQSASGFAYFQVPQASAAATVYISGLGNAVTGKELFYFEIPMSGN